MHVKPNESVLATMYKYNIYTYLLDDYSLINFSYSELFDRWKLFFQIRFLKTFAWKWVKIRFLPCCDLIKAFTVRVYDNYNSIALQAVDIDDLEGWEFSKKFRAKSSGDMKKLMGCVGY